MVRLQIYVKDCYRLRGACALLKRSAAVSPRRRGPIPLHRMRHAAAPRPAGASSAQDPRFRGGMAALWGGDFADTLRGPLRSLEDFLASDRAVGRCDGGKPILRAGRHAGAGKGPHFLIRPGAHPVHGRAFVPDQDVADPPFMGIDHVGPRRAVDQVFGKPAGGGPVFAPCAIDMVRQIKRLSSRHRVGPDGAPGLTLIAGDFRQVQKARVRRHARRHDRMQEDGVFRPVAQILRQVVPRRTGGDDFRLPAAGRDDTRGDRVDQRRRAQERAVGMPVAVGQKVEELQRLPVDRGAVIAPVRQDGQGRAVAGCGAGAVGVPVFQRAEQGGKVQMRCLVQVLPPEEEEGLFLEQLADFRIMPVGGDPVQVDAFDFDPEAGVKRPGLHGCSGSLAPNSCGRA